METNSISGRHSASILSAVGKFHPGIRRPAASPPGVLMEGGSTIPVRTSQFLREQEDRLREPAVRKAQVAA